MRELIIKAQQGDKAAEEQLVSQNSRLVWSIVMRFANRGCEKEDCCGCSSPLLYSYLTTLKK